MPSQLALLLALAGLCQALPLQQPSKGKDAAGVTKNQLPLQTADELDLEKIGQRREGHDVNEEDLYQLGGLPEAENMANNHGQKPVKNLEPLAAKGGSGGSLDMTPKAVAEYLLITGDFAGFDSAVNDLLVANVIGQEEAQAYKDAVGYEYERLLRKLVDAEEAYLEDYLSTAAMVRPAPALGDMDPRARRRVAPLGKSDVPAGGLDNKASDVNMALRRMQLRSLLEREATLDELLQALVRDYISTDLGSNTENIAPVVPAAVPAPDQNGAQKQAAAVNEDKHVPYTVAPPTNKPQSVEA